MLIEKTLINVFRFLINANYKIFIENDSNINTLVKYCKNDIEVIFNINERDKEIYFALLFKGDITLCVSDKISHWKIYFPKHNNNIVFNDISELTKNKIDMNKFELKREKYILEMHKMFSPKKGQLHMLELYAEIVTILLENGDNVRGGE